MDYLILCPHPDDEIHINFSLLHDKPHDVVIAVFTTGKAGTNDCDPNCIGSDLVSQRYSETIHAMKELDILPEQIVFLGFDDGRENESKTILEKDIRINQFVASIEYLCSLFSPKEVFAPAPFEVHIDHRFLGLALLKANITAKKTFSCYPKTIQVPDPDFSILLDELVFQLRLEIASKCYPSQSFLCEKLATDDFKTDRYWFADTIKNEISCNVPCSIKEITEEDEEYRYLFDDSNSKWNRVRKVLKKKYQQQDPWNYASSNYEKNRFDFLTGFILKSIDKGAQIIDMGCGNGFLCCNLQKVGYHKIIGFDCVDKAVSEARQKAPNIQFVEKDFVNAILYLKAHHIAVGLFMFNDCVYYIHVTNFIRLIKQIQIYYPLAEIVISGGGHLDMKGYFTQMLPYYNVQCASLMSYPPVDELIAVRFTPKVPMLLTVQSSKHIAPPVLAFIIVAHKDAVIEKLPKITDVDYMLSIMEGLGAAVSDREPNIWKIVNSTNKIDDWSRYEGQIRQSLILFAECVHHDHLQVPIPHGDEIGSRPIDEYFRVLRLFGFSAKIEETCVDISKKATLSPKTINLKVDSTGVSILTVTMFVLLAPLYKEKKINVVKINNVSRDLEFEWFVDFINQNVVSEQSPIIYDRNSNTVHIRPSFLDLRESLSYQIPCDRVVLFDMVLFIGGELLISNKTQVYSIDIEPEVFEKVIGAPVISMLTRFGLSFEYCEGKVMISSNSTREQIIQTIDKIHIEASKYPDLSTDMLPILATFLKILGVEITTHDKYFEWRQPLLFGELEKLEGECRFDWNSANIRQTVCGLFCLLFTDKVSSVVDSNSSIFRGYEKDFIGKIEAITNRKIKVTICGTKTLFSLWN